MTKFFAGLGVSLLLAGISPAAAADLGGSCCADLEERVAELEATTARKGNKKVSLVIYGQVNASITSVSLGDFEQTKVGLDGRDESFVGFRVNAKISEGFSAGGVIEVELRQLGILDTGIGGTELQTRQAYVYAKSSALGQVSLGHTAQATKDFNKINTSNTAVAALPNSLQPLSDAYLTGLDVPYDGRYRDIVRYDSPSLGGFMLSASWGAAQSATDDQGNTYDVAVRYVGELSGFKIAAGAGYRHDEDITVNLVGVTTLTIPTGDVTTYLFSGSVMHANSGLFVSAYYADQDWDDLGLKLKSWTVQGGVERKLFTQLGDTTLFGEYGQTEASLFGGSADIPVYGLGIVQTFDAAALDLYATWRQIDTDELLGEKVDQFSLGARIAF